MGLGGVYMYAFLEVEHWKCWEKNSNLAIQPSLIGIH